MSKNYYIAVDFDGTLCDNQFPDIGRLRTDVVEMLLRKKRGLESVEIRPIFILWTCRSDTPERAYLSEAVSWWKENGYDKKYFPLTYINENPEVDFGHPELVKKIFANEYWDDRAVGV